MSKPAPRRPSRTSTPKPRKIAGRDVPPAAAEPAAEESTSPSPSLSVSKPSKASKASKAPTPAKPPSRPAGDDEDRSRASALGSLGATRMLLVLVAVLAVLLALQGGWFYFHEKENDDRAEQAQVAAQADDDAGEDEPIAVPSGRPVVLNQLAVQEGVDAAAAAAQIMFARSWKTYDDGVDDAVKLMTVPFAEEYRATTDDVRREFIAKKTEVQVRVVAQSVVRANDTELEALIFLNQYIFRGQGENARTTYTPYRAVLTMVHTDSGWLVDGVDTK